MVPAAFVLLDALPLTANGKVDRAALPAPAWQERETYVAPQGDLERALAAIWQEVLTGPPAGLDDNFFDRGGHSLLMVQVQSKIREQLHQEISIIDLFVYPTIRSLAGHIRGLSAPAAPRGSEPAPTASRPTVGADQRVGPTRGNLSQQRQLRRDHRLHSGQEKN